MQQGYFPIHIQELQYEKNREPQRTKNHCHTLYISQHYLTKRIFSTNRYSCQSITLVVSILYAVNKSIRNFVPYIVFSIHVYCYIVNHEDQDYKQDIHPAPR